ncbi:phage tail tape measure protein [Psychrobacter sp. CAM01]|uniref:phage tail tape measure protein n=1 Tax=Psychrobacter sp. CAM01 TaxID=3080335 RepID=UPI0029360A8D|nr:phage tail tape measure protein [Psychrobacter sp. CAM01]MDV2859137.1 phage tail tape measure protein [Psychrobacter sp. CAM01]
MADLNFRAQIELLDRMTAPMRSIASQADRLGRQFGETAQAAKKLQGQQRLIDSFKQQKQALAETSEQAQRSRMRLEQLERQMRDTANPSATLIRQFEAAGRESQRLNTRLDSQRQHLQQLRGRLSDAGISTSNLSSHERELARNIERTNQQLAEQRRRMNEVRRLERQSQNMSSMRGNAIGLAAGGAAATYAGARFIQPGLDLETNLSKVQAVTRLDKNSPQYQALVEQAKELGASTQFTSADAAAGQTFLAMAGFTPESVKAAMPGMLDLALAGGMELDRTADIASNILSGMKLDPAKMSQLGDVLAGTFTRSNTSIEMLGETMKYAAPNAALMGVSLEQSAAMAAKLGDNGIQASMAGTAMRAIMSRMASGPKATIEAFERLGVKTSDANGNLRQMPDILKEIHDKTKKLGNTEQAELFKDIAGEEAGGALAILVDQAGSGALQNLIGELQNAQGEAGNLANTMSDNTVGDFKSMTSAIDALRTSIFDANGGALREFIQTITSMTQRMTAFANANPELMSVLGKLFATLAIGAVIIGGLGAVMLTILGPMALLRASLVTLGLPTTLTPLSMLAKSFGMIGGAVKALTLTLMANPILALCLALAVLAFTIYKNWDTLGPMFAALWERIKAIFNMGIQALKSFIMNFTPVGLFIRAFAAVWPYLSSLGAKFKQYGMNMLEGLKNGILGKAQAVVSSISNVVGRIKGAFTGSKGMDIHSPSRVFDSYGGYMMQGLGRGILSNAGIPVSATKSIAGQINDYAPISIDSRKSILPPRGQSSIAMMGGMSSGNITININGATDPQAVAREVQRVLAGEQRNQMARQRSRFSDID